MGHSCKGDVLIPLDVAVDATGVLLWEEAFRNGVVKVAGKNDGADGDEKDDKLIAKNDTKTTVVQMDESIENAFRDAICAAMAASIDAKKISAEHRSGGERDK